jgi:hypothetical protein
MTTENQSQLPDKRLEETLTDRLWNALKEHCCVVPNKAKLISFLTEQKFRDAVTPLLQQPTTSERCGECGRPRGSSSSTRGRHECIFPATGADEGDQRYDACEQCCGHNPKFRDEQKRCWYNINCAPCGHRCGWVTIGRVKVDRETETETFERATPPANVAEGEAQRVSPKANVEWLKANADNYVGLWVALKNGELLDFDRTPEALRERLGPTKGTGILVTLAKCAPTTTISTSEAAIEAAREISSTFGLKFQEASLAQCTAIISAYLDKIRSKAVKQIETRLSDMARSLDHTAWKGFGQENSEYEKGYKRAMKVAADNVKREAAALQPLIDKKEGEDGS